MTIKNFQQLARTPLRKTALEIMEAGYAALDTRAIMKKTVRITDGTLRVNEQAFDLARFKRLIVIGIGKCAFDAADALEEILGERIPKGVILDVKGGILKHLKS